MQRRCKQCGETKPLTADHWYRRTRDRLGYQTRCIPCTRGALDAADAQRKARLPIVSTPDELAAVIQERAADVVDALLDAAQAGTPLVLDHLADALCAPCPQPDDEDYAGPECLLHLLAVMHSAELEERYPAGAPTVAALTDGDGGLGAGG